MFGSGPFDGTRRYFYDQQAVKGATNGRERSAGLDVDLECEPHELGNEGLERGAGVVGEVELRRFLE